MYAARVNTPDLDDRPALAFIALLALTMALTALSIDAMLPALGEISRDLNVATDNDRQLILIFVFAGLASAQIFYGPLSDRFGRKPIIYLGLTIFAIGAAISGMSESFSTMLAGRFLQGVGAASPRIVIMAMIRDRYKGDAMASIASLLMMVFVVVPIIAPLIGQGIVLIGHWRWIFYFFIFFAAAMLIWFALGQEETLAKENRIPFTPARLIGGAREVLTTPVTVGYTLTAGFTFGCFLGFLSSSQQILQEQYALGAKFPFAFGTLAVTFGVASFINSRLVLRFSTKPISLFSLRAQCVLSISFLIYCLITDGDVSLWMLMAYLGLALPLVSLLFGNLNAIAMEPLGHIAGIASSIIGSVRTLMSLMVGGLIGRAYDGSIIPLVTGFVVSALAGLLLATMTERYLAKQAIKAGTD